jgi:hypothetical protein
MASVNYALCFTFTNQTRIPLSTFFSLLAKVVLGITVRMFILFNTNPMKTTLPFFEVKLDEALVALKVALCLTFCSLTAIAQDVAAPTDFHAVQVGYTLELHWTDNADNETKYVLFKEWEDYYSLNDQIDLPANTEIYVDLNVKPNLEYRYSLWAEGETGFSTEVNLVGIVNVATAPAPTNVSAAPGPLMSIEISFTDNSDLETYYEIQHTNVPDDYYGSKKVPGGELNSTLSAYISEPPYNPYSQPPPEEVWYEPNTLVYIRVRAVIVDNGTLIYGPFSPVITTMSNPEPATPTDFVATANGNDVHLSWTDNAFNEAAYFIARFEGDFSPNTIHLIKLPANTTEYTDLNVSSNIEHHYWIMGLNDFEYTVWPPEYWNELFFRDETRVAKTSILIQELPPAPTDVTATILGPTSILVSFTDNSNIEFWYELLVSTTPDESTVVALLEGGGSSIGSAVEIEVPNLTPNTTYFFRVRGVFEYGGDLIYGSYSEVISASTLSLVPDPPVAEAATSITAKTFVAHWSPVDAATYYELDVFDIKDNTYVPGYEGKIVYGTSETVMIEKKSASHYSYLVRAVNESGESDNSNIIVVGKIRSASLAQDGTFDEDAISINQYPNPVVDKFNILISSPDEPIGELQIINHYGSQIHRQTIRTNESVEVDATPYPSGMYILKVRVGISTGSVKVIKME